MIPFRSALEVAAAIRTKAVSPVEVARAYLAEVDKSNPAVNAFVWRRDEELLTEARAAEDQLMRGAAHGAFFGVPLPIKDLTEVKGHPTTHGSKAAKDKIGRHDATVVKLMREAGFLVMGRTNSPEFGTLPVTENELHGATRNPWDLGRTPGGSSGGAAAAVAAGMAPIAHASDGGGSIRIPASCTGLVGLKPSRGRVPKGPWASEIMHGFSSDGCVSTTVADTAAFCDAIFQYDPTAWYSVAKAEAPFATYATTKPPRLRIGFTAKGPLDVPAAPSSLAAMTKTAGLLSDLGHHVEEARVDWPMSSEQLASDFFTVWSTGTHYVDLPDMTQIEPLTAGLRELGMRLSTADYVKAVLRLQVFSRRIVSDWGKEFDLLLTPTLAIEPPPIGWIFATGETDPTKLLWRCTEMVPYAGWCNVTGQPAISLPTHVSDSGLPIGTHLVAPPFREDLLLMVAAELEERLDWSAALPYRS